MNNLKLTDWFPAKVKPSMIGVYETDSEDGSYQFWDGCYWMYCAASPETAVSAGLALGQSAYQAPCWRGLAEDPNKEQA